MKVNLYMTLTLQSFFYCHGLKDISSFSWNQCHDDSHVQIFNIPLDTCVLECMLRATCVGVQYQRIKKLCGILTVQELETTLRTTCVGYIYIHRSAMKMEPKSCERYKQSADETCITECDLPCNLEQYATILGRPRVGSKLKVTCDPPLTQTGDQLIRCDENGQLSSVPVCQLPPNTNVALGRPAWQSSNHSNDVASLGVDGITNQNHGSGSCFHTAGIEERPWWVVDLGAIFRIKTVVAYNRQDCCADRFSNVSIFTSRASDLSNHELTGTVCIEKQGPFRDPKITFTCDPDTQGRYLKIILDKKNTTALHLCEVQVFAETIC